MLTANNYSDIQILQGSDFLYQLLFDDEHSDALYDDDDNSAYKYRASIQKDFTNTTVFQYNGSPVTNVMLTVDKVDELNIDIIMGGVDTAKFEDDFEGVWDLLEQNGTEYIRQMQGDVVISPMVTQPGHFG